jgi:HK97 family phage portal protein
MALITAKKSVLTRIGEWLTPNVRDVVVSGQEDRAARPGVFDDYWYTRVESPTAAGVSVNESTALKFSPVFAAVIKIAGTIASLPLITYREGEKGKKRDLKHPLYSILHHRPNPEQTRMQMWEALMAHLLLWGNCYCHIQQDLMGRPIALWPLDPSRMEVKRPDTNGPLVYQYRMTDSSEPVNFPPWEILHIAGLGFNGTIGYSVISLAREGIATGLAYEEYSARFFSNNATPSGIIEIDGLVDDKQRKVIREDWYAAYGGVSKSQLIGIMAQGMKFKPVSISQVDSQFLESRKFSVTEVCRWFNIAPHMIFDLERSTNNNIEQQSLEAVIYTFRPWCVRIEQAIQNKLIIEDDVTVEHRLEGLLRGDTAARTAFYTAGIQNGWLCPNDIRELENLELIEGGDTYLRPLNMIPLGQDAPVESNAQQEGKIIQMQLKNKKGESNASS